MSRKNRLASDCVVSAEQPFSSSFLIPSLPHSSAALLTPELFCVYVASSSSSFAGGGGGALCHIVKQSNHIPRSLRWHSFLLRMLP